MFLLKPEKGDKDRGYIEKGDLREKWVWSD